MAKTVVEILRVRPPASSLHKFSISYTKAYSLEKLKSQIIAFSFTVRSLRDEMVQQNRDGIIFSSDPVTFL